MHPRLRILGALALLALALLAPGAAPALAAGTARYVNPGAVPGCPAPGGTTYDTIQDAVDAAGTGDTVWVCPGTYLENVYVSGKHSLTIRRYVVANTPPPTVNANDNTAFYIETDSSAITIRGLHMTNAYIGVWSWGPRTSLRAHRPQLKAGDGCPIALL